MDIISHIKSYILFLKTRCHLSITLHPMERENVILSGELISFNIHDNPYCIYVKSFPAAQKHCVACQRKVLKKCADGAFFGRCYAGCGEYVYPISNGERVVGFISVSGYGGKGAESYLDALSKSYAIPRGSLGKAYAALKGEIPSRAEIDALLYPLCDMLELAYLRSRESAAAEEALMDRILYYIKLHHTQNITLADVCAHFSCSRSHVSHQFRQKTGKTMREYLTALRLEDAKALLQHSHLGVTDIACSLGFSDSNYFSNVFKKHVGCSPLAFRKAQREGGGAV